MTAYDSDGYAWALEQADALRRRSANEVDWDNVAEEIDDVGRIIARELHSRYVILITHLLKWIYQPNRRSRSWTGTMDEQRTRIAVHVEQHPSLQSVQDAEFLRAYRVARSAAARQTRLEKSLFPVDPPFTREQLLAEDWLPDDEPRA